jgi:hypothetical protein
MYSYIQMYISDCEVVKCIVYLNIGGHDDNLE